MNYATLIIDTLDLYPNIALEDMGQQLLRIASQKVHSSDAGQGANHASYGDVVVDSLDDHFREPCLVPGALDELTDELIFYCDSHWVSASLSQCGCGGRERGGEEREGGGGRGEVERESACVSVHEYAQTTLEGVNY